MVVRINLVLGSKGNNVFEALKKPMFLLFESFYPSGLFRCHREDGGSVLTTRFMTTAEQKHKVLKLSKSVILVFFNSTHRVLQVSLFFVPVS